MFIFSFQSWTSVGNLLVNIASTFRTDSELEEVSAYLYMLLWENFLYNSKKVVSKS